MVIKSTIEDDYIVVRRESIFNSDKVCSDLSITLCAYDFYIVVVVRVDVVCVCVCVVCTLSFDSDAMEFQECHEIIRLLAARCSGVFGSSIL